MYKILLCWRYLRTRYIALASVISVMLGVATMIVVNSVMAGFSDKMRDRLHGVLADVIVESRDFDGFRNAAEVMARIREAGGEDVLAMAPTMETPAMLNWTFRGRSMTRPVQLIGVVPQERAKTGDFAEFLIDEKGAKIPPSFAVPDAGQLTDGAGRRLSDEEDPEIREMLKQKYQESAPWGVILGYAISTYHHEGKDYCVIPPGTQVNLVFPQAGRPPKATTAVGTAIGYFKSGHERVRLESRLYADRGTPEVAAPGRPRGPGQRRRDPGPGQGRPTASTSTSCPPGSRRRSGSSSRATSSSPPGRRSRGRSWRRWRSSRRS